MFCLPLHNIPSLFKKRGDIHNPVACQVLDNIIAPNRNYFKASFLPCDEDGFETLPDEINLMESRAVVSKDQWRLASMTFLALLGGVTRFANKQQESFSGPFSFHTTYGYKRAISKRWFVEWKPEKIALETVLESGQMVFDDGEVLDGSLLKSVTLFCLDSGAIDNSSLYQCRHQLSITCVQNSPNNVSHLSVKYKRVVDGWRYFLAEVGMSLYQNGEFSCDDIRIYR